MRSRPFDAEQLDREAAAGQKVFGDPAVLVTHRRGVMARKRYDHRHPQTKGEKAEQQKTDCLS